MKIRPYLTFQGTCEEAICLYKLAFQTDTIEITRYRDFANDSDFIVPEEYLNQILQATLAFGNEFIQMSDCGPGGSLNDSESERISLAIEASPEVIHHAFEILSKEGRIGIPLAETFYSPCAGVVFDKFGVMWNFFAPKEEKW